MDRFDVIKLLSDKNRYNIFMKLLDFDRLCVCEIEELLGLKQANTSKHLKYFKEFGIVDTVREKNIIYYSLKSDFIKENEEIIKYIMF